MFGEQKKAHHLKDDGPNDMRFLRSSYLIFLLYSAIPNTNVVTNTKV